MQCWSWQDPYKESHFHCITFIFITFYTSVLLLFVKNRTDKLRQDLKRLYFCIFDHLLAAVFVVRAVWFVCTNKLKIKKQNNRQCVSSLCKGWEEGGSSEFQSMKPSHQLWKPTILLVWDLPKRRPSMERNKKTCLLFLLLALLHVGALENCPSVPDIS